MEFTAAQLADAVDGIELAATAALDYEQTYLLHGLNRLDVRLTPRSAGASEWS